MHSKFSMIDDDDDRDGFGCVHQSISKSLSTHLHIIASEAAVCNVFCTIYFSHVWDYLIFLL